MSPFFPEKETYGIKLSYKIKYSSNTYLTNPLAIKETLFAVEVLSNSDTSIIDEFPMIKKHFFLKDEASQLSSSFQ